MAEIRRFARRVAERFQPEKIILFGSHAYGTPHADSDVDIPVIMPARNQHDQAVGKVLYEKGRTEMGAEGRGRLSPRRHDSRRKRAV